MFSQIALPLQVVDELRAHGIELAAEAGPGLSGDFIRTETASSTAQPEDAVHLQDADLAVFALAELRSFNCTVLTDDLALRRVLENNGATVAGSVGILIRAYAGGLLSRPEMHTAIEALLERSTPHLRRAFRVYVRHLVAALPTGSAQAEGEEAR